jgi:ABC-type sugar transport system substrate-binding protein
MKNITRKVLMVLLVLSLAAMAVQASGQRSGGSASSDQIVIGACIQGNASGFVQYQIAAMLQYMETKAPKNVKLEIVYANDDPATQQSQVEQFVSRKVNVIILNPVDRVQSGSAADYAVDNGIPVINFANETVSRKISAHVGSTDIESGKMQMERILSVKPNAKIAYIDAVMGHSAQIARSQGYKEVMGNHPQSSLVVTSNADWDTGKAMQLVENWLRTYPNGIDAILAESDSMLIGAVTAVENAGLGGKLLLSGVDADMQILQKIKAGVVDNTVWNDGVGQGEEVIRVAIEKALGQEVRDVNIPFQLVTRDNVDRYIQLANDRNALAAKYF